MGCDEIQNKFWSSYKHILIDSDLKKIVNVKPVYLISSASIPKYIRILEESKIFKYKNNSDDKTFEKYQNALIESFKEYELEKNIKIYNNYIKCKDLAGGSDEKMNEFIIVDEQFLDIMLIENDINDNVLIKWNDKKDRQIIYFQKEQLHLDFENKTNRKDIYEFKIIEEKCNLDLSFDKDKKSDIIIKKKVLNKEENNNNNNNQISHFQKKEIKNDICESKDYKNEFLKPINKIISSNNHINNQDEKFLNQFNFNKKKDNIKSNHIGIQKKLENIDNNMCIIQNNMNFNNNNMNNNNCSNLMENKKDINNNNCFNNGIGDQNFINIRNNINNNNNMNHNINNNNMNNNIMNNIPNLNNLFMNMNMNMNKVGMVNNMMMTPNMNNNCMNNPNMNVNFGNNNMNNINNVQLFNNQNQNPNNFNNNIGNSINIFCMNNPQFINNNNQMINNNPMINNNQQCVNNNEQNFQNIQFKNNNIQNIQVNKQTNDNNYKIYLYEISKFKEPPLIGLSNIGVTCYMNATLQCLSNINLLTGFFLSNKKKFLNIPFNSQDKPISKAYSDVLYHLWNPNEPNKYYSPNYFKDVISSKNKLFQGIQANDSKDLLLFLYENIHKELNELTVSNIFNNADSNQKNAEYELMQFRENYSRENKSIITDLFYFDQANITTCLSCGAKIYNFSMYNVLIFPLEKTRLLKVERNNNIQSVNIKDCFDCHINPERNQPGNQFFCNSCGKESDYLIENKISSYPEILTIVLNRGNHLEFDVNFTLSHLLDEIDDYLIQLNCNKNELGTKYRLIGIIIHTGNSGMDGHFFTYCRSSINRKWYWFNDAMVREINDPIEENKGIPYLLFYQKIRK